MSNRDTALEFLKCFCSADVDGLKPLLAEDLLFSGPFYSFTSREEYLISLQRDPPERCSHRLLSVMEGEDSVSIYYRYEKSDRVLTIAQLFQFRSGKISEILLVFDGRA